MSPALSALRAFVAQIDAIAAELYAEFDASRQQSHHRAALAAKYNVESHLWGSDSFFRECARKEACRRNR